MVDAASNSRRLLRLELLLPPALPALAICYFFFGERDFN
jgi:hypothetical protein